MGHELLRYFIGARIEVGKHCRHAINYLFFAQLSCGGILGLGRFLFGQRIGHVWIFQEKELKYLPFSSIRDFFHASNILL